MAGAWQVCSATGNRCGGMRAYLAAHVCRFSALGNAACEDVRVLVDVGVGRCVALGTDGCGY